VDGDKKTEKKKEDEAEKKRRKKRRKKKGEMNRSSKREQSSEKDVSFQKAKTKRASMVGGSSSHFDQCSFASFAPSASPIFIFFSTPISPFIYILVLEPVVLGVDSPVAGSPPLPFLSLSISNSL
jgi:hypothetical protein